MALALFFIIVTVIITRELADRTQQNVIRCLEHGEHGEDRLVRRIVGSDVRGVERKATHGWIKEVERGVVVEKGG